MTERQAMIVIADTHIAVDENDRQEEFFAMLDAIALTSEDVLFLGDNIDLWIASAAKYECEMHHRFLEWCRREKSRRRVMYVEGNHEFYVCRHHSDCFTVCTERIYRENGVSFTHGDLSQNSLGFHRLFRAFAKNWFGDTVMSLLPGGVVFAKFMKKRLSHNPRCSDYIPYQFVVPWTERECREHGSRLVMMGHFHCGGKKTLPGGEQLVILPSWKWRGVIGQLDMKTLDLRIDEWKSLLSKQL